LLFEKESSKSYSKGLREAFLCRFEVYRTVIFNKQLSRHHISVREGVLVDTSLVDTPHKPNGKISLTNGQGIVQKVITTTANRSDTKEFIPLLEGANIPQGTAGLPDKGYYP